MNRYYWQALAVSIPIAVLAAVVHVNRRGVSGKWHEMNGRMKQGWGKLTNDEIAQFEGRIEALSGEIQQKVRRQE